jgi:hypothetical protein
VISVVTLELTHIERFKYWLAVAYLSPLFTRERLANMSLLNFVGEPLHRVLSCADESLWIKKEL